MKRSLDRRRRGAPWCWPGCSDDDPIRSGSMGSADDPARRAVRDR